MKRKQIVDGGHWESGAYHCCSTVVPHAVIITPQFIWGHRGQISLPVCSALLCCKVDVTPCCISHRHHCCNMLDTSLPFPISPCPPRANTKSCFITVSHPSGNFCLFFFFIGFHVSTSPSVGVYSIPCLSLHLSSLFPPPLPVTAVCPQ